MAGNAACPTQRASRRRDMFLFIVGVVAGVAAASVGGWLYARSLKKEIHF